MRLTADGNSSSRKVLGNAPGTRRFTEPKAALLPLIVNVHCCPALNTLCSLPASAHSPAPVLATLTAERFCCSLHTVTCQSLDNWKYRAAGPYTIARQFTSPAVFSKRTNSRASIGCENSCRKSQFIADPKNRS